MEYNIKNSSNIEQLYISLRMSVWLSFYWLGDNEIENQINKVSFQNSQTEQTFIVIESRINLISFGWFGSVLLVLCTPLAGFILLNE